MTPIMCYVISRGIAIIRRRSIGARAMDRLRTIVRDPLILYVCACLVRLRANYEVRFTIVSMDCNGDL